MADTQTADIRALLGGGTGEDRVAATHFLVGAGFLIVGGTLALLSLFSIRFADLFPITYGRLEPMANLALLFGFGVISLLGGIYYVLPRLTGARLWSDGLAGSGLLGLAGLVVLGLLIVGFGFGSGRQPLGLPWWFHIPMLILLTLPVVITMGTISRRVEERSFVTLWFVIGGVTWLPLLYLAYFAGDLPFISSVAVDYSNVFLSAGFVTMFLFTVGSGLFYYTLVKELDVSLASRQLALVGFWSLGFAAAWWGAAQLIFGPAPTWVSGVAAALGLAFPIGALANAANASLTIEGSWNELGEKPAVSAGVYGLYLGVGVAILAALAGFRSIAAVASLTTFWEAIEYVAISGPGALLIAGVSFAALPRIVGRELHSVKRARTFNRLTVIGSVGTLIFLGGSGLLSGYSWIAGSNSAAYIDAGEGWAADIGTSVETLLLVAIGFAIVTYAGQFAYASAIFGTVTRGTAAKQEVLVARVIDSE
ncbi:MAG: cbb3-type cytochrome c oxidase subunit I [Acidimicrobiia bacterium]